MEEKAQEQVRRIVAQAVSRAIQNGRFFPQTGQKPEHLTCLRGKELVLKDHPRIAFRGAIDSLEAELILVQGKAKEHRCMRLFHDLGEIIDLIRRLLRCEVSGDPVGAVCLQGLNEQQLREHSHHPGTYYGRKHFLPTAEHGEVVSLLNHLRTKARETELIAYRAFREADGTVSREDILRALNRLSSLFWIMMFKYLAGAYTEALTIEVEASGRHVHLSQKDVETLFGPGYQLTRVRDLSQPGQYVCSERVSVTGPKGTIQNVVVLGPVREETQVELSFTDGLTLGIKPPVRLSGELEGTPGAILSQGGRQLVLPKGVIVAKRHIHVEKADAEALGVADQDQVAIEVLGSRPVIFEDTVVRVSEQYRTYVHIDYDEANACGFEAGMRCRIVR